MNRRLKWMVDAFQFNKDFDKYLKPVLLRDDDVPPGASTNDYTVQKREDLSASSNPIPNPSLSRAAGAAVENRGTESRNETLRHGTSTTVDSESSSVDDATDSVLRGAQSSTTREAGSTGK